MLNNSFKFLLECASGKSVPRDRLDFAADIHQLGFSRNQWGHKQRQSDRHSGLRSPVAEIHQVQTEIDFSGQALSNRETVRGRGKRCITCFTIIK